VPELEPQLAPLIADGLGGRGLFLRLGGGSASGKQSIRVLVSDAGFPLSSKACPYGHRGRKWNVQVDNPPRSGSVALHNRVERNIRPPPPPFPGRIESGYSVQGSRTITEADGPKSPVA